MKGVLFILLVTTALFSKVVVVDTCDCFETLEKEILQLINNQEEKDQLKIKIKETFNKNCPETIKKQLVIEKSEDIKACVDNLESEILRIVTDSKHNGQAMEVEILIDNINKNFDDCKKKAPCPQSK